MLCEFLNAGVTFKETWNTDNVLQAEVSVEDQLVQGLKLSLDTNFAPQSGYIGQIEDC